MITATAILHTVDGSQTYKNILIIIVDTDVVIIALCHFFSLSLSELWVEFGVGQNRKYLPIHKITYSLGEETCRALTMRLMLTGCDTVSIFFRSWQEDCVKSMEGVCRSYRNLRLFFMSFSVLIFMSVYIMHDIVFNFLFFISILNIEQINIS